MKKIAILFLLFVTFACNNGANDCKDISCEIDRTKSQAILLHDDVMAKMGEMRSLKIKLVSEDSLATEENHLKLKGIIVQIDSADKQMWNWMHQFNTHFAGKTDSLTLAYYGEQLESIKKVQEAINSSISSGNSYLENN